MKSLRVWSLWGGCCCPAPGQQAEAVWGLLPGLAGLVAEAVSYSTFTVYSAFTIGMGQPVYVVWELGGQ
jgi:hypothetical protein